MLLLRALGLRLRALLLRALVLRGCQALQRGWAWHHAWHQAQGPPRRGRSLRVLDVHLARPPKTFSMRNLHQGLSEGLRKLNRHRLQSRRAALEVRRASQWHGLHELPQTQVRHRGLRRLVLAKNCGLIHLRKVFEQIRQPAQVHAIRHLALRHVGPGHVGSALRFHLVVPCLKLKSRLLPDVRVPLVEQNEKGRVRLLGREAHAQGRGMVDQQVQALKVAGVLGHTDQNFPLLRLQKKRQGCVVLQAPSAATVVGGCHAENTGVCAAERALLSQARALALEVWPLRSCMQDASAHKSGVAAAWFQRQLPPANIKVEKFLHVYTRFQCNFACICANLYTNIQMSVLYNCWLAQARKSIKTLTVLTVLTAFSPEK